MSEWLGNPAINQKVFFNFICYLYFRRQVPYKTIKRERKAKTVQHTISIYFIKHTKYEDFVPMSSSVRSKSIAAL